MVLNNLWSVFEDNGLFRAANLSGLEHPSTSSEPSLLHGVDSASTIILYWLFPCYVCIGSLPTRT